MMRSRGYFMIFFALLSLLGHAFAVTDPNDLQVLQSFLQGVSNSKALQWVGDDPCSNWNHIKCQGSAVIGLQVASLNLGGQVTPDLNKMKNLQSLQLQGNGFSGPLPSLSGLSSLKSAYFGGNAFDIIPAGFFSGLNSLTEIYLDENRLNGTQGWMLPDDLANSTTLTTLSLSNTSLTGSIPSFLGGIASLKSLTMAYNRLSGGIPSSFASSNIAELKVNNQQSPVLSGPIDVVGSMQSLQILWLHVNHFSGAIPTGLVDCLSLQELRLNDNQLVGTVPLGLTSLPALKNITVKNNQLVGEIPKFSDAVGFDYGGQNNFCQTSPGIVCAPEVTALLDFLAAVGFPSALTSSWIGNDPCKDWTGIVCDTKNIHVSVLSLPNSQLNGTLSPSLGNLTGLTTVKLNNNRLSGLIPQSLTNLPLLAALDLSNNLLSSPLPKFSSAVKLDISGNPLSPVTPAAPLSPGSSGSVHPSPQQQQEQQQQQLHSNKKKATSTIAGVVVGAGVCMLLVALICFLFKKKGHKFLRLHNTNTLVVHPRDSGSDPDVVKIVVTGSGVSTVSNNTASDAETIRTAHSGASSELQVVEAGNLVISIQVLREATHNFSEATILGRGGFGVVYKGVLYDGTNIAVKRMESSSSFVSSKGMNEFQAEIAVLTRVRHRHLVALLGYCIEGNEKLLVYEYMPQGTLSQRLFEYQKLNLKPLDWKQRLTIALDVARGIEYLHGLAQQSFIHRDLKPSNILLGDDLRAKVSDFGLVKLAPQGKYSVETRLAGTFGYLAPEYAVTGRVTTKADVFSYGVILMEMITGRRALDETEAEENMHLVAWFKRMVNSGGLESAVDPVLEGIFGGDASAIAEEKSVRVVAELAGHCCGREAHGRPDMGHVVNVLSGLVEHWMPSKNSNYCYDEEDCDEGGIDLEMTLPQAVKRWQALDGVGWNDTHTSLPPRPSGFAHSFTSDDAR